jgi:hypothetical protein
VSGGSFNYLCHKDVVQLLESGMADLEEMAVELEGLGHVAKAPAVRTRAVQSRLRAMQTELDAELRELEPVWQAVEWWRSCDWGRDQVLVAIGEYRERQRSAEKAQP